MQPLAAPAVPPRPERPKPGAGWLVYALALVIALTVLTAFRIAQEPPSEPEPTPAAGASASVSVGDAHRAGLIELVGTGLRYGDLVGSTSHVGVPAGVGPGDLTGRVFRPETGAAT